MKPASVAFLLLLSPAFFLTSCVESTGTGSGLSPAGSATGPTSGNTPSSAVRMTKHDAALRFLTAYIRLDRSMALGIADARAVSKLDWNVPHRGNIPYYDDKMLLHFNGGWARVYFQEVNGSYRISDLEVHRR